MTELRNLPAGVTLAHSRDPHPFSSVQVATMSVILIGARCPGLEGYDQSVSVPPSRGER